jgi:hypothetical protein
MLSRLLAALLGVVFALGLAETTLRWVAPQEASWLEIYRQEPGLPYYTMRANLRDTIETGEGRWHVHTDARGRRVAREPRPEQPDAPLVLVLGDSFTFGQGVEYEDSFVGHLAARFGSAARVVNTGVNGYGPVQYRHVLESELALGARPRVVLVNVFVGNDFLDCIWNKQLAVVDGAIATADDSLRAWVKRHLHLYRLLSKAYQRFVPGRAGGRPAPEEIYREAAWRAGELARAREVFAEELRRITEIAASADATVVVTLIPTADAIAPGAGPGVELPIAQARAVLATLPVTVLDLTDMLRSLGVRRAYFARDGHLTPEANAAVADALWPLLNGPLETES